MGTDADRQLTMIAFLQAANCSNYPGSWRHAHTHSDFLSADYFQRIARTLEAGKFHLAFFDDRLAMPDRYGDNVEATLEHGIRAVKFDLIPIMTAMGLATERLGIGGTYSTTYYEPFHVARVFASLDHMIKGRAAWNVVTSLNDSEAANFGFDSHPEHDKRYDRADEFMRAVLGHWDSWDADALVLDRASGRFADASKVRRLNHVGEFFKTRGPFTVPRSPQGRPVVIQAGQSGRGRQFAARWGELVFAIMHSEEFGRTIRQQLRDEVASIGRNPDEVRIAPAVYTIVGETQTMAEEKAAYVEGLAEGIDTLVLLSEALNFDFATKGLNDPFTDDELNNISGLQAIRDRVVGVSGKPNPTSQDFIDYSGRGTVHEVPCFVGSPSQVADQMESWFVGGACDGFVLAATHIPGGYEDFVRLVVPELQRRGLYHNDYRGGSLRETLGLAHPDPYDWKFD